MLCSFSRSGAKLQPPAGRDDPGAEGDLWRPNPAEALLVNQCEIRDLRTVTKD
jgi:hypothetical protein